MRRQRLPKQQPDIIRRLSEAYHVPETVAAYEPWSNGWAIGFKVTHPDGRVEFVYLNPSTLEDPEHETPNVFLYHGTTGDPSDDGTVCYVDLFRGDGRDG